MSRIAGYSSCESLTTIRTGAPGASCARRVGEDLAHRLDVAPERATRSGPPRPRRSHRRAVGEPEQLVRVPVLLVVVDQARVGRRGDDAVGPRRQPHRPRVGVQDLDVARAAHRRELAQPPDRVGRVAGEELRAPPRPAGTRACACGSGTARSPASRGKSRSKCVVSRAERAARERMTRATSRARLRQSSTARAVREQLGQRLRRVPAPSHGVAPPRRRRGAAPLRARRAARARARRASSARVFTRASRQLKAEMSQPTASAPNTFASTSVVPEPANGS